VGKPCKKVKLPEGGIVHKPNFPKSVDKHAFYTEESDKVCTDNTKLILTLSML